MTIVMKDRDRTTKCAESLGLYRALDVAQRLDQVFHVSAQMDSDSDTERLIFMIEMSVFDAKLYTEVRRKFADFDNISILPFNKTTNSAVA